MANNLQEARVEFVRPIAVATMLTFGGEMLILLVWGVLLFPDGGLLPKVVWTATCGIAMGATIGAATIVLVTGRLNGLAAAFVAAVVSFGVLTFCTVLCYRLDLTLDLFGARSTPVLFIAGGIVPAILASGLYGWLLHSRSGSRLLALAGW